MFEIYHDRPVVIGYFYLQRQMRTGFTKVLQKTTICAAAEKKEIDNFIARSQLQTVFWELNALARPGVSQPFHRKGIKIFLLNPCGPFTA